MGRSPQYLPHLLHGKPHWETARGSNQVWSAGPRWPQPGAPPHTLHRDLERRSKQCKEAENDQTPDCSRHLASQGESREHRRLRPRSFTRTHQNEGARWTRPLRHSGAHGRCGQSMHPVAKTKMLKDFSAQRVAVINANEGRVPRRAALRSDATAVTPRSLPPAVLGWTSHRRLPPHRSGGIPNRGP